MIENKECGLKKAQQNPAMLMAEKCSTTISFKIFFNSKVFMVFFFLILTRQGDVINRKLHCIIT